MNWVKPQCFPLLWVLTLKSNVLCKVKQVVETSPLDLMVMIQALSNWEVARYTHSKTRLFLLISLMSEAITHITQWLWASQDQQFLKQVQFWMWLNFILKQKVLPTPTRTPQTIIWTQMNLQRSTCPLTTNLLFSIILFNSQPYSNQPSRFQTTTQNISIKMFTLRGTTKMKTNRDQCTQLLTVSHK